MLNDFYTFFFFSDCTLGVGRNIDFPSPYGLLLLLLLACMLRKVRIGKWELFHFFKIITLVSTMNARLMRTEEFIIIIVIPQ